MRLSWTRWRLTSLAKRQQREAKRLRLMQVQQDSQLLLLSLLEQREQLLLYQERELLEIQSFRLEGRLPMLEPAPKTELDRLLGL